MPTATNIATLVGNPRPASRTSRVAHAVAARVAQELGGAGVSSAIELAGHAGDLFTASAPAVDRDRAAAASADVLVVASPTYKATYTGLLKAFLDRYEGDGLAGVTAIPVMVGASAHHALAVEVHLRPLLVELGAVVPGRGLFVLDGEVDDADAVAERWWTASGAAVRASVGAARATVAAGGAA
ncbi:NADPH-dependent FMN reductase [Nocardioides sp. J54]|uniref:NADPH-dependent FMN reductase n=1 Tax=Nocardioides sp. J54 TaxID=935866 RepID=UPI00048C5B1F|nr:NAD(P)H-dependent oxidoreductase [Nocardioides sp. J54]